MEVKWNQNGIEMEPKENWNGTEMEPNQYQNEENANLDFYIIK